MTTCEQTNEFRVLVTAGGRLPTRGSENAAGWDLYAAADVEFVDGKARVPTGLKIAVPAGTYGRIAPRSGLAAKYSIDVGAGVIDADYRGFVDVLLFKYSSEPVILKAGERIAQLIIERIDTRPLVQVRDESELSTTTRGAGGFGSTGV